MEVITAAPIAFLKGTLPDGSYVIKSKNGKMFLTKKPVFTKPPTEKQLEARRKFGERAKNGEFRRKPSKTSELFG